MGRLYAKKVDKMAQMTSPNYSADVIRRPNTANYWSPVYVFININNIFISYQILDFYNIVLLGIIWVACTFGSFYSFRARGS